MAVAFTQLAAINALTTNTSSYAGTAGTPVAGDLLICFAYISATVAAGSMTGGGWTWTKLTSFSTGVQSGTLYVFWAYASAATSTTPLMDVSGDNGTGSIIQCFRITGSEGVQVPSIRQFKTNTNAGSANPSVTMDAAIKTENGVIGMSVNATNSATQYTAPTSWTEGGEIGMGTTPAAGGETAFRASGETNTTITWTNANTTAWAAIVLEINVPQFRSVSGGAAISSPMFY